jgi:TolB-like protein
LGPDDKTAPDIEIEGLTDGQTVYTDTIYISGQVVDNNRIATLTINKTPFISNTGRSIVFSHLTELSEGKNIITIEARDKAGNTAKKDIVVIRENPQFSKLPKEVFDRRMRLAVYPFDQKGAVSEESSIFLDMLTLALQHQTRFQLTERTLMDRILKEQKLSLTQLINQDTAVKAGRIMSAQAIVTGSIMRTGGGIELIGRMIDTETSEIMATEKIYSSKNDTSALNFLAQSLSVRLHNDFPMLGGIVVTRQGSNIFTSLGQDKVAMNARLIIYREKTREGDSAPGSYSTVLGYARVTQVLKDMSKAELTMDRPDDIRILDRVVAQ